MDQKTLHILELVRKLYQRYGIKSVTMDDVASRIGISKKTLYGHFKDKEDLVRQVLLLEENSRCSFLASIEQRNLNAVEELFEVYKMLQTTFREYNPSMDYDVRKYYPDLFTKLREMNRKRMFESMHRNLLKGKKEGLFRKDLNAKTIARLHVFRTESLLSNNMFTLKELTSFKMFHEVFIYHLHGILSEKGRIFFEQNFRKFKSTLP
ncbi:MAG: helix-turn-helix domain-containing protein [Bacteroidota bacterium]